PNCLNCYPLLPISYDASNIIKVWNSTDHTLLYSFPLYTNYIRTDQQIRQIRFSPDGRILATSSTHLAASSNLWRITLRESQHGTLLRTLAIDQPFVSNFAFSPDGRMLAVATNDYPDSNLGIDPYFVVLRLYDVTSGALLHTFQGWKK